MDVRNILEVGGASGGVVIIVLLVYRLLLRSYRSSSCTANSTGVVVSLNTSSAKAPEIAGETEAKEAK